MASIFEPGKSSSTIRQPASSGKREAVLALLQSIAASGRPIGGYPGKAGKPALNLNLGALINTIQTDPDALTKITQQSGRPSSPSTFQNLSQGLVTALLLGKVMTDKGGGSSGGLSLLERILALGQGQGTEPMTGTPFADLGNADTDYGSGLMDFLSGLDVGGNATSDGTFGVNASDMGGGIDDLSWLWS